MVSSRQQPNPLTQIALTCLLAAALLAGCSSGLKVRKDGFTLVVPPGVDSTVAIQADTIAGRLFVSIEQEEQADRFKLAGKSRTTQSDTLWKYLAATPDPALQASGQDSVRSVEAFNAGARSLQELAALEQQADRDQATARNLLLEARKSFESAVVLNPFDLESKSWLARVYQTLAIRYLDEQNYERAVNVLENLLRIERGEHALYARLAEAYFATEEWQEAYHNFAMAESVMRDGAGLELDPQTAGQSAPPDSATIFYYVYYQADCELKMHEAARGLATLRRARTYAASDKERQDIQSYIDWVNWDDGNTRAVELRDKYIALQEEGEHKDAAKGFEKLLPQLKTRKSIDEILWRLAVTEFQFLQRQNAGIARLQDVVQMAVKSTDGAPADSTYIPYFDSYGVMCHNLGLENVKKNRKVAFAYFKQAVAIAWENRAKSHLEIAKLSRNDPRAVIASCLAALNNPGQLEAVEQTQAYQLLVEALKRSGRFDEARTYYGRWVALQNANRSARR